MVESPGFFKSRTPTCLGLGATLAAVARRNRVALTRHAESQYMSAEGCACAENP